MAEDQKKTPVLSKYSAYLRLNDNQDQRLKKGIIFDSLIILFDLKT